MKNGRVKKLTLFFGPRLVPWLIRLLGMTVRVKVKDPYGFIKNKSKQPYLVAFWHNRIVMMPYFYRKYFKTDLPCKVMISTSRDGQLIADIIKSFGIGTFRGSSSKHGIRAMRTMARELGETKINLAITPDGPRGPLYKVQPGIVYLAASSGLPIVPVTYSFTWKWTTKSWDRMPIPIPFTRCELIVGEPLLVAEGDDLEEKASELERRLGH